MSDTFAYTALSRRAIRLLEFQPGSADEKLVGSMRIVPIDHTPPYEAISYVWGNPERTAEILCDNQVLGITASLSGALQRVRSADKPRLLWADAICIDQSNLIERSEQVQLMRSIYQQAREVLVWLGPSDENSGGEEVFKFFNRLWEECNSIDAVGLLNSDVLGKLGSMKKHELQTFPPKDSPLWDSLHLFYRRPWFTRVWIIQEVAVSTSALIMYGKEEISWQKLGAASSLLLIRAMQSETRIHPGHLERFLSNCSNAGLIWGWTLTNVTRNKKKRTLGGFLDAARRFAATDPRDKVYALLGLVETPLQSEIKRDSGPIMPDYTLPFHQVCRSVATKLAHESRTLDVLYAVDHESSKFTDFPSWVPDWSRVKETSAIGGSARTQYRASGTHAFVPQSQDNADCFLVSGLEFDTVSRRTLVMNPEHFDPKVRVRQPTAWMDSMSRTNTYLTGEASEAAYSLTLTANVTRDMKSASASENLAQHMANFSAYLCDYYERANISEKCISEELRAAAKGGDGAGFAMAARNMCIGRRFFITEKGYIGIGPAVLKEHDLVCVLFGGVTPFVLRKENDYYRFIGEAYVHGLMNGEAIQQLEAEELSAKTFRLL